jgi:hypothetical protein
MTLEPEQRAEASKMTHRTVLLMALISLVLAGLADGQAALSPRNPTKPGGTLSIQKNAGQASNANLLSELKEVGQLLVKANHDYQGHRAEALKQVKMAAHALHPHHHNKANGNSGTGTSNSLRTAPRKSNLQQVQGKQNAQAEPQTVSDSQLKQAHDKLTGIAGQMGGQSGNARHTKALQHIQAAIKELETALAIR